MKKLPLVFVCLITLFAGTGCMRLVNYLQAVAASASGDGEDGVADEGTFDVEASAVRTEAACTYTNSYLDFSYTVPKGWWLYEVNENNFAADPSETVSPERLDISYGEDAGMDYSYVRLAFFANLKDSRRDNHIGFDISAETLDGVSSLEEYMEYLEYYMLEPDENSYSLLDSGQVEINGLRYEKRTFEVLRDKDNYIFVTYTRPAGNNYYLTIKASYWPKNRNAGDFIVKGLSDAMP